MADPENITVSVHLAQDAAAEGAGWLLEDGRVITCAHVVGTCPLPWVRFRGGAAVRYKAERVLPVSQTETPAFAYDGDLALLEPLDEAGKLSPLNAYRAGLARHGDPVTAFGFPTDRPGGRSASGRVGSAIPPGRREVIAPERQAEAMTQGFSGGPVVSVEDKTVIGLFAVTNHAAVRGIVIPARQIEDWLKREGMDATWVASGEEWPSQRIGKLQRTVFGSGGTVDDYDLRVRPLAVDADPARSAEPAETYGPEDVPPAAFVNVARRPGGQAILYAQGGGGKSSFLVQLATALERAAINFLWLDLKKLRGAAGSGLAPSLELPPAELMQWLGDKVSPTVVPADLASPQSHIAIIADGINEVGSDANRLLNALERFVATRNRVSLVATTRSTTRVTPTEETAFFTLQPLPTDEIERVTATSVAGWTPARLRLFASPQMLNLAVRSGNLEEKRHGEIFRGYVLSAIAAAREAIGRTDGEMSDDAVLCALAQLSYTMLQRGALTAPWAWWEEGLADALVKAAEDTTQTGGVRPDRPAADALSNALTEFGLLTCEGQAQARQIGLQHPLLAEWLAVWHFVALGRDSWTSAGFKAISLEDSSEDGLRLALELATAGKEVEPFLLRMYNWRWQRVLALAAEKPEGLTPQLREALIGLNALRLLDGFQHTRDQARPLIERLVQEGDAFAAGLLAASAADHDTLLAAIRERFPERLSDTDAVSLEGWRQLLFLPTPAGEAGVGALLCDDAFVGWSASNILRLTGVTAEAAGAIRAGYRASLTTARSLAPQEVAPTYNRAEAGVGLRWRIVHTLGRAAPKAEAEVTAAFLLAVWRDGREHPDVRFGACRSLLELALAVPDRRAAIFASFEETLAHWAGEPAAPKDWRLAAAKAAEQLWRAWPPAAGELDEDEALRWNEALHHILSEAKKTATVLEWPAKELDATLARLKPES